LLLSRPGVAGASVQKGGKVIVPRPVNLPSLRREHAGNDPSIALVGGSGASGWTKAPLQEEAPVAATSSESTGRFVRHVHMLWHSSLSRLCSSRHSCAYGFRWIMIYQATENSILVSLSLLLTFERNLWLPFGLRSPSL
jgi:hypothetical protein